MLCIQIAQVTRCKTALGTVKEQKT